jgi:hypothetical protein
MSPAAALKLHASARASILACVLAGLTFAPLATGCAPEVGDECSNALDCSASASRVCDRTQPSGYCTLLGCEEGTCPEEAVCVRFNPSVDRLASTYCMFKCEDSSDCRSDQGYRCLRAESRSSNMSETDPKAFGAGVEAEILGNPKQKFCAYRSELPSPDAGTDSGK